MVAEVSNFGVDDIAACMQQSWPPEPLELYSREALRATADTVQAERWLLPSVGLRYWRRVQVLGRGGWVLQILPILILCALCRYVMSTS